LSGPQGWVGSAAAEAAGCLAGLFAESVVVAAAPAALGALGADR